MKYRRLLFILASALVLVSLSCKNSETPESPPEIEYNIVGTWSMAITIDGATSNSAAIFTGTKDSGTVKMTIQGQLCNGIYRVTDKLIHIESYPDHDTDITMDGQFMGTNNKMTGTGDKVEGGASHHPITWTATRA
jgi:hypothetical protein